MPPTDKPLRKCRDCGLEAWDEAGLEAFAPHPGARYGKRNMCRKCQYAVSESRVRRDPEQMSRRRERQREYRVKNRARRCEYNRKYCSEHPELMPGAYRRYYAANRDARCEAAKKWARENPEKTKARRKRYLARRKGANGDMGADDLRVMGILLGTECLRCGKTENITLDHVIPISRGGWHAIHNAQPLCRSCNASKKVKSTDYRPDWYHDLVEACA